MKFDTRQAINNLLFFITFGIVEIHSIREVTKDV